MKEKKLNQIKANRERKSGKELYYTNEDVVNTCVAKIAPYIKDKHIILEPCAGDGAFIKGIKEAGISNKILAFDIEPRHPEILTVDFLKTSLKGFNNLFAITNPPFGRANSLSVKFFNHLAKNCDYIAFLVPRSWRKWSIQNKLDRKFHLVLDVDLPLDTFHAPDGTPHEGGVLKTVFQIWEKQGTLRPLTVIEDRGYFTKTSPKDADVAFTAFGYNTGKVERNFDRVYNSCKLFLKVKDQSVIDALENIDVSQFTQNVAYTEVISMAELRWLLNNHFDNQNSGLA